MSPFLVLICHRVPGASHNADTNTEIWVGNEPPVLEYGASVHVIPWEDEETYLELKAGWLSQLKDELKGIAEGTREYLSSESYYDYESWKVPHYLRFAHEAGLVVTRNDRKETRDICENLCMETTIWVEIP